MSLADAEEIAFKNNPRIKIASSELQLSRAKQTQASHAVFLPVFNLRNVWGPIPRARALLTDHGLTSPDTSTGFSDLRYFTQVELEVLQPIWTFGKTSRLRDAADSGVDGAIADVARSKADIQLLVRRAYWGLILGYELLSVVEDILSEAEDAEDRLQELFDEGSEQVTQNDLFEFQIFMYEIGKAHREAQDRIVLGKAGLRAVMELDATTDFALETQVLDPLDVTLDSLPAYTVMALTGRPEIMRLSAGIDARSALVAAERSDYWPHFFFGANVAYNRAPSRFDTKNPFLFNPTNFFRPGVLVGFNWNLNFVQTRDRVRIAQSQLAAISQREAPLRSAIRLEVKKAYLKVRQAEENIGESRRALRASNNWLRAETQTFEIGVGEVTDVMDSFRANARMRAEYLENIFALNASLAALSKAVGRDLYPE